MARSLAESREGLEERTAELGAAYEQLLTESKERRQLEGQLLQSQKMEAMGRLAGGVAHDFNNLLTPILVYAQLTARALPPEERGLREDLGEIERAAKRAADLIRQLLAFSRRQMVEPKVLNLNILVLELDKLLRRTVGEDVELLTLLGPNLGSVKIDPGQMEQVLVNLVVNARDAMPAGGKITIETSNVALDEEYARVHPDVSAGEYVRVAVSDTGSGMTEEVKARIFEPFYTTKEVGKGTGLGLSTCYGIVVQSGGHITVDSEPGGGTTVNIYLPQIEEPVARPDGQGDRAALPRGSERVLLVEDEPSVRRTASRILTDQGYSVLEASNGDEALSLSKRHADGEIDLLLTDVVMPLMGGMELAERFKEPHASAKVIYTSGYVDETAIGREAPDRDGDFVQKPFTAEALARKVREVLDRD